MCLSMKRATSRFGNWAREICHSMRDTPIAVQIATLLSLGIGSMVLTFLGLVIFRKFSRSQDKKVKENFNNETSKYVLDV